MTHAALASRWRPLRRWLAALAALIVVVACGGGVGTGGTGSFASGPINGFGSILVGGVFFDESNARIEADDGSGRSRTELRLGTVVEIDSGEIRNGVATASQVRIASALIGRVQTKAAAALVINGMTVHVQASTAFDEGFVGGLAGVPIGATVEVHGFVTSSSGDILATRIEPEGPNAAHKFSGTVTALNRTARTFDIGTQHFSYPASLAAVDQLANGAVLRVTVDNQLDAQGRWPVTSIGTAGPPAGSRGQGRAHGVISSFTSIADFRVGGTPVDASTAQIVGGTLGAQVRVEVEGGLLGGVLIATRVEVDDDTDNEIEVRGRIVNVDAAAKVIEFNGNRERVSYARIDVVYEDGTVADLAVGRRVRAYGQLSADGTRVDARRIRFDD